MYWPPVAEEVYWLVLLTIELVLQVEYRLPESSLETIRLWPLLTSSLML